eukprot:2482363-Amphidinium_carterae.3
MGRPVSYQSTQSPHRYATRRNAHNLRAKHQRKSRRLAVLGVEVIEECRSSLVQSSLDITKKDLYRPLPEGVRNIRTVLHDSIKEGEIEEKVNKSRGECHVQEACW